jgi:DNA topoisomerase-2
MLAGDFKQLSQLEHVLQRPDMYIGTKEPCASERLVITRAARGRAAAAVDGVALEGAAGVLEGAAGVLEGAAAEESAPKLSAWRARVASVTVALGFRNVVRELIVNAMDHQFRDPSMRRIDINVLDGGVLSVKNDGQGIPVRHTTVADGRQVYIPSLVFGEMLTGSNFEEASGASGASGAAEAASSEQHYRRYTGGRNGVGGKVANITAQWFSVETADVDAKLVFHQKWTDHMRSSTPPLVKAYKNKRGYTKVTFLPDYAYFGSPAGLSESARDVIETLAMDAAACASARVSVYFNDVLLPVKHLRDFTSLFSDVKPAYDCVALDSPSEQQQQQQQQSASGQQQQQQQALEVCVVPRSEGMQHQEALGFVNSMECSRGKHMELVWSTLTRALGGEVARVYKREVKVTPATVKAELMLVVRALVPNPAFGSQTKEELVTPAAALGFKWAAPSAAFLGALQASGVLARVYAASCRKEESKLKAEAGLSSRVSRNVVVDKYRGALDACKPGSSCSLLLTEGDSAAGTAIAGLAAIGRATHGVFALKGKMLNVRNAPMPQILGNEEITNLLKVTGLTLGKTYSSLQELRYKKWIVFTDQDLDGAHIAGLIVNLVHVLFPSVLQVDPEFVQRFATPLVRATPVSGAAAGASSAAAGASSASAAGASSSAAGASSASAAGASSSAAGAPGAQKQHVFYCAQDYEAWRRELGEEGIKGFRVRYYKGLGTSSPAEARAYFRHIQDQLIGVRYNGAEADGVFKTLFDKKEVDARRALLNDDAYNPGATVNYAQDSVTWREFALGEVLHFSYADNVRSIPEVLDGLKPSQRKVLYTFFKNGVLKPLQVAQAAADVMKATAYHHGEASITETLVGMAQQHVCNINLLQPHGQFGSRDNEPSVHAAGRYISTCLDPIARFIFCEADDAILEAQEDDGRPIEPQKYVPVIPFLLVNGAFGIGTGYSTDVPQFNPLDVLAVTRLQATQDPAWEAAAAALRPWYDGFTGAVEPAADGAFLLKGVYECGADRLHIRDLPPEVWTAPFLKRVHALDAVTKVEDTSSDTRVSIVVHCSNPQDVLAALLSKLTKKVSCTNMHVFSDGRLRKVGVRGVFQAHAAARLRAYAARKASMLAQLRLKAHKLENKARFIKERLAKTLELGGLKKDAVVQLMRQRQYQELPDFDYLLGMSFWQETREAADRLQADALQAGRDVAALEATPEQQLWTQDLDALEAEYARFVSRKRAAMTDEEDGEAKDGGAARKRKAGSTSSKAQKRVCK